MPQDALVPHIFACLDGNHVVLLDVRKDRYSVLEARPDRCLEMHPTLEKIEKPLRGFSPHDYWDSEPLRWSVVPAFLAALVTANFATRCWSFERMVCRVKRRNARCRLRSKPSIEHLQRLVAVFGQLRPFFFGSRDACLFESFALLEFLARQGIYANWVFGVQARPFVAHCWVQQHRVVLNDSVESAGGYTVIMVV